jgi:bacterial/archaeal transporter family protein
VWIAYGFLAGLILGSYDLFTKLGVRQAPVLSVTLWSAFFGFLPFVLAEPWLGNLSSAGSFSAQLQVLPKSLGMTVSWVLAYFAVKHLALSHAAPIRASGPVWTLLAGMVFFGDRLTWTQSLGLGLCIAVYWWLGTQGSAKGPLSVPWACAMLVATWLSGLVTVYDKYLVTHSALALPLIQTISALQRVILTALLVAIVSKWTGQNLFKRPKQWAVLMIGISWVAAEFVYFFAVADPHSDVAALAVLRRASLLIAVGYGAWLFHEKQFAQKIIAMALLLVGMASMLR